eukprot:scaffold2353_cov167-Amphora_coffeaeformis.AAC.55
MKAFLTLARRTLYQSSRCIAVPQRLLYSLKTTSRCLASIPSSQTTSPPPSTRGIFPFAVDAPDGSCEADSAEEQRIVNDFVEVEAEHAFCKRLEEDHVDFYGPLDGPLHLTHPPESMEKMKRGKLVSPQHLLAITEEDLTRIKRENFLKVGCGQEDLHFCSTEDSSASNDPAKFVAVDGPDGTADDTLKEDLEEINHLIEEAALKEDRDFVERLHAQQADAARIYAVEAPDGTPDDAQAKEYEAAQDIVEREAHLHDPAFVAVLHYEQQQIERIYAVDSPDGMSDDLLLEELHQIEDIIDHAAEYEDKDEVRRVHQEVKDLKETMSKNLPDPFDKP